MNQLPYALDYMHKFNIHKWLGLKVDDDDLVSIARIYGVRPGELRKVEKSFQANVADLAARLAQGRGKPAAEGAGGTGSPAAPLVVLALGDSITSDRESYVRILNCYWKGTRRKVIDCAVSGDTTSHFIDRWYGTIMNQQFDWVVIFIGTNDCRQADDPAHIARTSLQEYQRNMEYFTDQFLARGKKVVLVTIPPVDMKRFHAFLPDNGWIYDRERIDATNRWLGELAARKGLKVADLAKALETESSDFMTPDGLHLNSTGHLILSRLLVEILP
jgi:lysophospholipase L1-like esterase